MQTSTAYFAGAGTVVIAIVVGLGGGMLVADIMNPKTPGLEMAKLERRTAAQSQAATQPTPNAQPAPSASPNSYLAATAGTATAPVVVAPAAANPPSQPQQAAEQVPPQPAPAANAPSQPAAATPASIASAGSAQSNPQEAAVAKARDSDLKARDGELKTGDNDAKAADAKAADAKAADADRGRSAGRHHGERRQQWAERRRSLRARDPDIRDVEQAVREDSSPRAYVAEPAGMDMPRIRLFDRD